MSLNNLSRINVGILLAIGTSIVSCSAAEPTSNAKLNCPVVENVDKLLASSESIIIVGEVHGYVEPPKLIEALICHSLKANYRTVFGIEISQDRAKDINDYVNSSGDTYAKNKILSDSRWLSIGDGRQTQATFDILNSVRNYRSHDYPISTMSFVPSNADLNSLLAQPNFSAAYEKSLAKNITDSFEMQQPDKMIVLVGNLHAKNGEGKFAGQTYPLMATHMKATQTITLNVMKTDKPMAITLFGEPQDGFDGVYHVPDWNKAPPVEDPFR